MRRIHARPAQAAREFEGREPMAAAIIIPSPGRLRPFRRLRLENTKRNRADVRPPCEKTYLTQGETRLNKAARPDETPNPRNRRPAEHLVRADGLL